MKNKIFTIKNIRKKVTKSKNIPLYKKDII